MKIILHIFIGLFLSFAILTLTYAQDPGDAQQSQGDQSLADVGAQLANPVSSVWSIVFQSNFIFLEGEPSGKTRFLYNLNFQPAMSVPLTDNWNLITRPVLPFLFGRPVFNPETGFVGTRRHTNGKSALAELTVQISLGCGTYVDIPYGDEAKSGSAEMAGRPRSCRSLFVEGVDLRRIPPAVAVVRG